MKTGPASDVRKRATGAGMLNSDADALTGGVCTKIKRVRAGKGHGMLLPKQWENYKAARAEMLKRKGESQ